MQYEASSTISPMLTKAQLDLFSTNTPFILKLAGKSDGSGLLNYWEQNEIFPNGIQRCFWVHGVDQSQSRGNHAHRSESQVLVAMSGRIYASVEDSAGKLHEYTLSHPGEGLFLPPMHWVSTRFEQDAVLLGMCNEPFSEDDYIRDKAEFNQLKR